MPLPPGSPDALRSVGPCPPAGGCFGSACAAGPDQWLLPLSSSSPIWWLRLGDSLVNLAPVLLLAVILLRFANFTLNPDADWALVFALLVPLQLISFGSLWLASGN